MRRFERREENEKKNEIAIRMDVGFICWSFIRQGYLGYGLDKVSGTFFNDVGKYMPVWLIVLIVLSFLIQLGIIFYKDE